MVIESGNAKIIPIFSSKITLLLVAHLGLLGIAPRALYFFNWEMVLLAQDVLYIFSYL
jgi:hypothetical protein